MRTRFLSVGIAGMALALAGCQTTTAQNGYQMNKKELADYNYFLSQGFDKDGATVYALNPAVQQGYFDDIKCQSYGAKKGSDPYVACRAQLERPH